MQSLKGVLCKLVQSNLPCPCFRDPFCECLRDVRGVEEGDCSARQAWNCAISPFEAFEAFAAFSQERSHDDTRAIKARCFPRCPNCSIDLLLAFWLCLRKDDVESCFHLIRTLLVSQVFSLVLLATILLRNSARLSDLVALLASLYTRKSTCKTRNDC